MEPGFRNRGDCHRFHLRGADIFAYRTDFGPVWTENGGFLGNRLSQHRTVRADVYQAAMAAVPVFWGGTDGCRGDAQPGDIGFGVQLVYPPEGQGRWESRGSASGWAVPCCP